MFDLQKVDFVASAFLRICLTVYKEASQLSIVNMQPDVGMVFKISGFSNLITGV